MDSKRFTRPSPAFVVALLALFFALGGTAGAVVTAAVPLAKRALVADTAKKAVVADNAKKLSGLTAAQLGGAAVQVALKQSPPGPRPASSAAGLVSIKTGTTTIAANNGAEVTVACDTGQKIAGAGYTSAQALIAFESYPVSDSSWRMYLVNLSETSPASTTLYATCVR